MEIIICEQLNSSTAQLKRSYHHPPKWVSKRTLFRLIPWSHLLLVGHWTVTEGRNYLELFCMFNTRTNRTEKKLNKFVNVEIQGIDWKAEVFHTWTIFEMAIHLHINCITFCLMNEIYSIMSIEHWTLWKHHKMWSIEFDNSRWICYSSHSVSPLVYIAKKTRIN